MDTEELGQKLKNLFSKGAAASKEAFEKAGDKVQEFTDKSVNKIEIKQLETKLNEKHAVLGKLVYEDIEESGAIKIKESENKEKILNLKKEIEDLQNQIKQKEALL